MVSGAGETNGDCALELGEGDDIGGGDDEGVGRGDSPAKIAPSAAAGSVVATGTFQVM